jgi:cytochrome c oxidase subunit 2
MADGNGPGRTTLSGIAFGGLMLILIIVSLWLFIGQRWWFPELASVHGKEIDSVFMIVLVVTGIAFVIVQGMLGYFVARYGANGKERAAYWHDNPKVELLLLTSTAIILTLMVVKGRNVWASIYFADKPANAIVVEATAEQFVWNFHYPGNDGAFGRSDVKLISNTNSIGLDRDDPAAKDDIVTQRQMHVPVDRPVIVRLRSKDVIHSFSLTNLRVKQDAVPGMAIESWFTPNKIGKYEIACAELCGLQHYRMKGELTVESEQDYKKWLEEQLKEQQQ